jgi:hypothetical protein
VTEVLEEIQPSNRAVIFVRSIDRQYNLMMTPIPALHVLRQLRDGLVSDLNVLKLLGR